MQCRKMVWALHRRPVAWNFMSLDMDDILSISDVITTKLLINESRGSV